MKYWEPDPVSVVGTRDDLKVVVVAQSEHRLYVLVEVPGQTIVPPTPSRSGWNIRVLVGDVDQPLRTGGGGAYGSKDLTFVTAAFDPVEDYEVLDLAVELDGDEVYRAQLVRVN